jgi:hypothetical protein
MLNLDAMSINAIEKLLNIVDREMNDIDDEMNEAALELIVNYVVPTEEIEL